MQRVREILLEADPRIEECIKWQAPTFTYEGNLASFFPKSKQHASLMFHLGAQIPGKHPRLEGTTATGRVINLATVAEANAAKKDLVAIVKAWCSWREAAQGTKTPRAKKPSRASKPTRKSKAR